MRISQRFIVFIIVATAAIFFEWQFLLFTGRSFEWVLAVLVTAAFFIEPIEVAALIFFALWLMGGRLTLGIGETAVLAGLPLTMSFLQGHLPMMRWLALSLAIAAGVILQIFFANPALFADQRFFLAGDALGSAAFGVIFFLGLAQFYPHTKNLMWGFISG